MDRFSKAFTLAISKTMKDELELVVTDMAEEAQQKEQAVKITMAQLLQDIKELEASRDCEKEERQEEKKRLEAAVEAVQEEERVKCRDSLAQIDLQIKRVTEERELEREKRWALEKENRRLLLLLELKQDEDYERRMAKETEEMIREAERWDRWTKERENATLTTALSAASLKQQLLMELKQKAGKWMESDTSSTGEIPQVFRSWMLREKWMKLQQNNQHYLNDCLQSFCYRKNIEEIIEQNQRKQHEINQRWERKMKRLMAETAAKEEKIQAAALKEKKKLEQKIKKEMEKAHKAEMKEKKREESKQKKQAKKLEKKKSKEENQEKKSETRPRRRFAFWRRS